MRVVVVSTPAELEAAWEVRFEVFVTEQGVAADAERDAIDTDPSTLHVLVVDEAGEPLATGRLIAPFADSAHGEGGHGDMDSSRPHIGRVAVRASARGTGAGRAVMEALEAAALERYGEGGEVVVELSAQDQAMPFYELLGYVACGEGYLDEGIWHHDAAKVVRVGSGAA